MIVMLVALILPIVAIFSSASGSKGPLLLPGTTLVSAPPTGAKGPDDITLLTTAGVDNGKPVIWTAYQNGINPNGTASTSGGPTQSTVAGYDASTGALIKTIQVTGKVDGLTADPQLGKLIATVNEDEFSALNLVDPANGTVTTYKYSPDPAVSGNGGTDSIAIWDGRIFVAHSNPNDTAQPVEYEVTLNTPTLTADLTPVFLDNATATDAVSGKTAPLGFADPDTNFVIGSDLVTIGQADGKLVFASNLGPKPQLTVLNLTDNKPGNVPPTDGLAVATSDRGTLYVIDNKADWIQAFNTTGWPAGTVFISEASDNGNPLVGTLDLATGKITPFSNSFVGPKGLLFVPASSVSAVTTSATMITVTTTTTTTNAASGTGVMTTTTIATSTVTMTPTVSEMTTTAISTVTTTMTTTASSSAGGSSTDLTSYALVAAAIVIAGIAIGFGMLRRKR